MVFSSILFIFRFLPAALLIYFITPNKFKNFTLLILSLIFYSWGETKYILIMFASIFIDYFVSRGIEKYRGKNKIALCLLCISIIFNLGMLFFFKYFNFFIDNINTVFNLALNHVKITLPLGISFYTFQTMSYSIDVYRGRVKAEKNIINFGAFVCLFPQLIAGPIVKYTDIQRELSHRVINKEQIEEGIELFILGLGRKVLIANNIGMLWTEVEAIGFTSISTILAWLGVLAFAFQIYFDFSGYSLMAIGLGKMLGFNFPRNFNHPYIARSMSEFWRRWHITLGSWFREYVYIPLGGNRVSSLRMVFNLFIVWFLTGFWHGASWTFIAWGLYFGFFIAIEKAFLNKVLSKIYTPIRHLYLIMVVMIGWVFFRADNFHYAFNYIKCLFGINGNILYDNSTLIYLNDYIYIIIVAIIFSTPIIRIIKPRLRKFENNHIYYILKSIIFMSIFISVVIKLVNSTYNPFLYFRF